uniref:WD repeat-containing protein 18 n=1 Tax=Lygus hesperus TaxID=30085 RepID=A0A0A9XUP6_LYGHE
MVESINFPSGLTYVVVDPTQTYLYGCGVDGTIYKVTMKETVTKYVSTVTSDNATKVTVDTIVNTTKEGTQHEISTMIGHKQQVTSATLSLDGNILCSTSIDGTIYIWDVNTNQSIRVLSSNRVSYNAVIMLYNVYDTLQLKKKHIVSFTQLQKSIDSYSTVECDDTMPNKHSIAVIKLHTTPPNSFINYTTKDTNIYNLLSDRPLQVPPHEIFTNKND